KLQTEVKSLHCELDREKEALIEAVNQIAYLRNDTLAKSHRCQEFSQQLARNREEHATATTSLSLCENKLTDTKTAQENCLAQSHDRGIEAAEVTALIQTLLEPKENQEKNSHALKKLRGTQRTNSRKPLQTGVAGKFTEELRGLPRRRPGHHAQTTA